ncbi:autotransporter outer membrane beta-barrel domain-containing protein [Pseudomonas sp. Irchel s3a12]|uniref:autotransporter outer membrane beta-barrel domain-containing protein n=1 Tax=Pseudomonas sp. Irchel s3a12 TaxID=2009047 RepID=UPI000BA3A1F9|nr:autotransporter outer membrane beta-barrel domain-containing protein [Pseudomonas sp. Irchel s3a12]
MNAKYVVSPERFKKKLLSILICQATALLSALSLPAAAQQVKANGTSITTDDGISINTSGSDYLDGIGLYALSKGKIFTSDASVTTDGERAFGAHASGADSLIEISGGRIRSSGATSHGAYAVFGSKLNLRRDSSGDGVEVVVTGDAAYGVTAVQGANILIDGAVINVEGNRVGENLAGGIKVHDASTATVTDSAISTTGDRSNGIYVSAKSQIKITGGSISTKGKTSNGVAVYAGSADLSDVQVSVNEGRGLIASSELSQVNMTRGSIITHSAGVIGGSAAYVAGGAQISIDGSSIETRGDDAQALHSGDTDSFINVVNTDVSTSGKGAHAIFASRGGLISLNNSILSTKGAEAGGVIASALGTASLDRVTIATEGVAARGIYLTDRSVGSLRSTSIQTDNTGASAVHLDNSILTGENIDIHTLGGGGHGLVLDGLGSKATLSQMHIKTQGNNANGLYSSGGEIRGSNIVVLTSGADAAGLLANYGALVSVVNSSISASGENGDGVIARNGSILTLDNVGITSDMGRSIAVDEGSGFASISNSSVTSRGDNGSATYANNGAVIDIKDTKLITQGDSAFGLHLTGNGTAMRAARSHITTLGDFSYGGWIGDNGKMTFNDSVIISHGNSSSGIHVTSGGTVAADGLTLITSGNDSVGVSLSDGSRASFGNSHIISEKSTALRVKSGNVAIDVMNNSSITGGNGVLLSGESASATVLSASENAHLNGNILVMDQDTRINLSLAGNSTWDGSAVRFSGPSVVLDLDLKGGSIWNMLSDSNVSSLRIADSTIAFSPPNSNRSAFEEFKTLTVAGNYIGDNGVLAMNARLGGDDSHSDKLIIQGDSSGETFLKLNNSSGQGHFTYGDGIEVVRVDGASNGVFKLGNRVVAGSNEYLLFQGGKTSEHDGDWYLRSEAPEEKHDDLVEVVGLEHPEQPEPVRPNKPSLYRPEIGAYLGNTRAAIGMFQHTLHERAGELDSSPTEGAQGSVWMRVKHNDFTGDTGENQIDLNTSTDTLQLGAEVARWTDGDDNYHLGVMAAKGKATTGISSNILGYNAKGEVEGYSVGMYGTWFQNGVDSTGAYVDTWLQSGHYENGVKGDGLARESYRSRTLSASVETGYALNMGQGESKAYYLEPQAQVIYTNFKADKHREENGTTVKSKASDNVTTRLGARAYVRPTEKSGTRIQPFVAVNWWHSEDDSAMSFNNITSKLSTANDTYEVKVGAEVDIGSGWSAWGHLSTQIATANQSETAGQFGVKYCW